MSNVLQNKVSERITELSSVNGTVIVLKGIPMKAAFPEYTDDVDLEALIKNKLGYFMELTKKRTVITYEEFLLLYDFLVSQYSEIYVLNNNIYMDQYPLDIVCSPETRSGLLNHFMDVDDEQSDDAMIGQIQELTALYVGVKEHHGFLIGAYCDERIKTSTKVEVINLFAESNYSIPKINGAEVFIDIIEEADYIDFVRKLFSEPDELCARTTNYTGDTYKLTHHLQILADNWSEWVDITLLLPQENKTTFKHRDEYSDILKTYWGYDSFRELPVYDLAKLEQGKKEVSLVSQEKIISDLVEQAENCANAGTDYRDVFVTAPTGAGKSVMFQIPAIYLANKHNLLTIVISPLIGLMTDQVKSLELKNYKSAKTINSDISPIIKQQIMSDVADGKIHILYLSPETLLSRSDIEQLIGDRTIGMIVIDEAHIVTTWGKQFRPDYWYLGDHIKKLRSKQIERKGQSFLVATFTATAIYHGVEDMYTETINSLHMLNPITYLGYVKRRDIDIVIQRPKKEPGSHKEYEPDKFAEIEKVIQRAIITNKKTLIYFPTVALIHRCYDYLRAKHMASRVAIYHGSLNKDQKLESYEQFMAKDKLVMLATKAFGMGIDINDIELVVHFAPTGNVCDYVQEIGRAARREDLRGEAYYSYESRDFKHINRLHGLSTIQKYQLIEVIQKIDELYTNSMKAGSKKLLTRKRNAMLLDAENFSYIFGASKDDGDVDINKVKTALLIIQKDFENKQGFSPVTVRPIPLFSVGFFAIEPRIQKELLRKYPNCLEEINSQHNICRVYLDVIWRRNYEKYSFPQFKYMLYVQDRELPIVTETPMRSVLCVSIEYATDYSSKFEKYWSTIRSCINKKVLSGTYISSNEIAQAIQEECGISKYKALAICEVVIASMDSYRNGIAKGMSPISKEMTTKDGVTKYLFYVAVGSYFSWIEKRFQQIVKNTINGELYLFNDEPISSREMTVVLGVLEALDVLSFKMLGGANSQLYIYVNQIQTLRNIISNPAMYRNQLLNAVSERHKLSVKMLSYLYENKFNSDEIWDLLEDYFLGHIPEAVKRACKKEIPTMHFDDD